MTKTTITETTKKYDKEGHLIEETTRTETTEDNTITYGSYPYGTQKDWTLTTNVGESL
jgi:hypothetical protein